MPSTNVIREITSQKGDIGRPCKINGKDEKWRQVSGWTRNGRRHQVDGRTILKWTLRTLDMCMWTWLMGCYGH